MTIKKNGSVNLSAVVIPIMVNGGQKTNEEDLYPKVYNSLKTIKNKKIANYIS